MVLCEAGLFLWKKPGQCFSLSPRGNQAAACLAKFFSFVFNLLSGQPTFYSTISDSTPANSRDMVSLGGGAVHLTIPFPGSGNFGIGYFLGSTFRIWNGLALGAGHQEGERLISLSANEDYLIWSQCILFHLFRSNFLHKLIFFNLNSRAAESSSIILSKFAYVVPLTK